MQKKSISNPCVYKITNLLNLKVYIGSTHDFDNRVYEHLKKLKINKHINKHIQKSFNKYGEDNFTFEVIEYCSSDILRDREYYFSCEYDSFNQEKGYNIAPIIQYTRLGMRHSDETKKRLSEVNRGNKFSVGCVRSEETRKKCSESGKGKRLNNTNAAKLSIEQVKEIRRLSSIGVSYNELVKMFEVTKPTICRVVKYKIFKHVA